MTTLNNIHAKPFPLNAGRRRTTTTWCPEVRGYVVTLEGVEKGDSEKPKDLWTAKLIVDGWPHDVNIWAKDELDVFKQVKAMLERKGAIIR